MRLAVTGWARFLTVNLKTSLPAANRAPEIDGGLILKVGAWLRSTRTLIVRSAKDAGEDVFETTPCRGASAGLRPCSALET
jgi:hypothetical protein